MGYEMPDRPKFLENALQGLAFWIGHRHSLFRFHPLTEGAMVAEACNLIFANLSDDLILKPECKYQRLLPQNVVENDLSNSARADLVILSKNAKNSLKNNGAELSTFTHFVMEVKRGSSSKAAIDDDLRRLFAFLRSHPGNARGFLILISESKSPTRFVSNGKSKLGTHEIPNSDGCYHVRRTVKAAASFSNTKKAHYACLIEVFTKRPKKLPLI